MKVENPSLAFFRYKRSIKALEMVDFIQQKTPRNDAMTGFYDALNALFDTINRAFKLTFWTVWGAEGN